MALRRRRGRRDVSGHGDLGGVPRNCVSNTYSKRAVTGGSAAQADIRSHGPLGYSSRRSIPLHIRVATMHPSLALLPLLSLTLVGCAVSPPLEMRYTSTDLGLAYYLPEASLIVTRERADEYVAKMHVGRKTTSPSQIDGITAIALDLLATYCPAWRLASAVGADSMMIQKVSAPPDAMWFRIQLSPKGPRPAGDLEDSEGRTFDDFAHEHSQSAKEFCTGSNRFNAARLVR